MIRKVVRLSGSWNSTWARPAASVSTAGAKSGGGPEAGAHGDAVGVAAAAAGGWPPSRRRAWRSTRSSSDSAGADRQAAQRVDGLDQVGQLVAGEAQHPLVHRPDRHLGGGAAAGRVLHLDVHLHGVARAVLGGVGRDLDGQPLAAPLHLELGVADASRRGGPGRRWRSAPGRPAGRGSAPGRRRRWGPTPRRWGCRGSRRRPSSCTRRADITPSRSTVSSASAAGKGLFTSTRAVCPTS